MDTYTSSTTEELLLQMASNDEMAFRELYVRYWKRLYGAAMKRLSDHDKVNDILQDVFIAMWIRRHSLQVVNVEAYLMGAVRNQVLKKMEKEGLFTPLDALSAELSVPGSPADALIVRKELRKTYLALVNTLTPSQRAIIKFRFEEDMTTEQIAQLMGISRKTVQNQLRMALVQIRGALATLIIVEFIVKRLL